MLCCCCVGGSWGLISVWGGDCGHRGQLPSASHRGVQWDWQLQHWGNPTNGNTIERLLFFCVKLCSFAQLSCLWKPEKLDWFLVPAPLLHCCTQLHVLSVKCYQAATGLELQTWSFGSPIQKLYGTAQTALRIYANHNPPALYMTFVSVSQFQFREGWFPAILDWSRTRSFCLKANLLPHKTSGEKDKFSSRLFVL